MRGNLVEHLVGLLMLGYNDQGFNVFICRQELHTAGDGARMG